MELRNLTFPPPCVVLLAHPARCVLADFLCLVHEVHKAATGPVSTRLRLLATELNAVFQKTFTSDNPRVVATSHSVTRQDLRPKTAIADTLHVTLMAVRSLSNRRQKTLRPHISEPVAPSAAL
jgi:hypothetical protein